MHHLSWKFPVFLEWKRDGGGFPFRATWILSSRGGIRYHERFFISCFPLPISSVFPSCFEIGDVSMSRGVMMMMAIPINVARKTTRNLLASKWPFLYDHYMNQPVSPIGNKAWTIVVLTKFRYFL